MEERERGSTVPLLAVAVVLVGMMVMGLGRVGAGAAARAAARTAADAAALAGAASGREAAEALARSNGAEVVAYEGIGLDTRVTVRLGQAEAVGRARRVGGTDGGAARHGAGRADAEGLAPAMRAALARAEQLLGEPVPIVSGYRSPQAQAALWANRASNPYPVAPPGSSMHERGLAVDVPLAFVPRLSAVAGEAGLCQPHADDPIHFEVCR